VILIDRGYIRTFILNLPITDTVCLTNIRYSCLLHTWRTCIFSDRYI